MSTVNKVILIARLTKDPELKHIPSGNAVCNISAATNEVWYDKDKQKQEKAEFHRLVIWGKQAESCNQYLKKGSLAYFEGKIETRSWDDKDGNKRYSTEVKVDKVQFLPSNKDVNQASQAAEAKKPDYNVSTDANFASDDIPF